jgi:predicted dehydrogenase
MRRVFQRRGDLPGHVLLGRDQLPYAGHGSWKSYYQNIAAVLNHGAELAVKPDEILRVMQVYDAAMQSAATGEVVKLAH